ncbi:MAG: hypothetical protein QXP98_05495 [Thermoproteus sp.]
MPRCSVCGREVNMSRIAYIRGDVFVCDDCFPNYYVKEVCRLVQKRLRGESPLACMYCKYKKICDDYVAKTLKSLA